VPFGSDPIGPFPTAGKSASGEAFICIGGLIGGILGIAVLSHAIAPLVNADAHLLEAVKVTPRASSWLGAFFLGALGGSWVGAKVHKFLQDVMGGHDPHTPTGKQEVTKQGEHVTGQDVFQWPSEAENVQHEALRCPTCGQTLRVPRLDREIVVTCPKCKNKFTREAKV
jgi:ribosomal protein L37AE/L43A